MSVKKDWVQVVKKVLMTQFDQIKGKTYCTLQTNCISILC